MESKTKLTCCLCGKKAAAIETTWIPEAGDQAGLTLPMLVCYHHAATDTKESIQRAQEK